VTIFRKKSGMTNILQAGILGLGNWEGTFEWQKIWISEVVTPSFWFSRFMSGLHKQVGELEK
jgi:hypothetical protein